MITNISLIAPHVKISFNSNLLSVPIADFRDTLQREKKMYEYFIKKYWKRLSNQPGNKRICMELQKQLMDLYERIEKEEKERDATKTYKNEIPFYYIKHASNESERIAFRLLKGTYSF